jgi:hypothetical protein
MSDADMTNLSDLALNVRGKSKSTTMYFPNSMIFFGAGKFKERDHLQDPDGDGRIISKWIFKK